MDLIEIDGSVLEGGGQILRLAMSFSTLLKRPIKVNKIRAGRSKGGLRPQHLKGIEMAREMCDGRLIGAAVESTEVTFHPENLKSGKFEADTLTAGSVGLLLQIALPIALFGPSFTILRLKGGTNADMAPPIDYTVNAFLPMLEKFGGNSECSIIRRGYFPKGGGEVELRITPAIVLNSVNITNFGIVTRIWGRSYVAGCLPVKIAHEMADAANEPLKKIISGNVNVDIKRVKELPHEAFGNGSGIVLFAETDTGCILSGSALGSRDKSSRDVGFKAATELVTTIQQKYCVDSYTQDQIIILMALASGKSIVKCGPITQHTKTAIYIAETLTNAKFAIIEKESDVNYLECDGIAFQNNYRCE